MDAIYDGLRSTVEELVVLEEEEWQAFSKMWEKKTVEKGEFLTHLGDVENWFYYVHEGVVRGFASKDGEDISIGFSYNGDYSGAYDSFLRRTPSEWCMQAIVKTETLRIHYQSLMELFDRYKCFERWGRLFNAQILIGMSKRQLEARSFTAEEKYHRLVDQSPHIFQYVPQKYLASYLGMTPETLSRLRSKTR